MNPLDNDFVTVPETALPDGTVVPSFRVMRYLASKGEDGAPVSAVDGTPWVEINHHETLLECLMAGFGLLTEKQALAIAWDISRQDINWTGGKVGEGDLIQGLRMGDFSSAQPANVEPKRPDERRWHQLSNGERIYDFAGNVFQHVFDDVQGDRYGLTTIIEADSLSLQAPFPPMEKGMGWRPDGKRDWSGLALIRGGCWYSGAYAGVFRLDYVWPGRRYGDVGFRCTKCL
jgi:hypothetical protein